MATPDSVEARVAATVTRLNSGTRKRRGAASATTSGAGNPQSTRGSDFPQQPGNSTPPSRGSKLRFKTPRNVEELTGQVARLATLVINDELSDEELDRVRVYANLIRSEAQMINARVTKARFLRQEPDLSLATEEEDGNS